MRKITDGLFFGGAVLLTVLTGGLLLLPLGLALAGVLLQRRREKRKGELERAKEY